MPMGHNSEVLAEKLAAPPQGFTVPEVSAARITITYHATRLGCWFGLLSVACFCGIAVVLTSLVIFWFPGVLPILRELILLAVLARLSLTLLFRRYCVMELSVSETTLEISRRFFGISRHTSVPWTELRVLKQSQDGGTSITLFESWGLCLLGTQAYWHLVSRERREVSDWLGEVLAELLGLEFRRAKRRGVPSER